MWKRFLFIGLLASISATADLKLVGEQTFDSEIQSGKVLVDFYGPWCGPCKKMEPLLSQFADEMSTDLKVIKVSIDDSSALAQRYNVMAVPTLIYFVDGQEKGRLVGFQSKANLKFLISPPSSPGATAVPDRNR